MNKVQERLKRKCAEKEGKRPEELPKKYKSQEEKSRDIIEKMRVNEVKLERLRQQRLDDELERRKLIDEIERRKRNAELERRKRNDELERSKQNDELALLAAEETVKTSEESKRAVSLKKILDDPISSNHEADTVRASEVKINRSADPLAAELHGRIPPQLGQRKLNDAFLAADETVNTSEESKRADDLKSLEKILDDPTPPQLQSLSSNHEGLNTVFAPLSADTVRASEEKIKRSADTPIAVFYCHNPPQAGHPPPLPSINFFNKQQMGLTQRPLSPKSMRLDSDSTKCDIDINLSEEHLQMSTISENVFDSEPVLGLQIALNKDYLCYALKGGVIEVVSRKNPGLKALSIGHSQRLTDMAFFADYVNILASISRDGKVVVCLIFESSEGDNQPCIAFSIVIALQIYGQDVGKNEHPREILVVSIDTRVLRIDTTKFGSYGAILSMAPLLCPLTEPIDGVQILGRHGEAVSDLSICQLSCKKIARLASSSVDGVVYIWQEDMEMPVTMFCTHGTGIWSVKFVKFQDRPEYSIIITGGIQNSEIRIWAPEDSGEGWLLKMNKSMICMQTLTLTSFVEPQNDRAFFNQMVPLFNSNMIVLANARNTDVYAVHLDYGSFPNATRMDYVSRFKVKEPILSFVGRSECAEDPLVSLYCVQAGAVTQYMLPDQRKVKSDSDILPRAVKSAPYLFPSSVKSVPKASTSVLSPELESIIVREVRAVFEPNGSGREALKELLKWNFVDSIIPDFERCCKTMFDQIDQSYQRGFGEHTSSVEKRIADHTSLVEKQIDTAFGRIDLALAKILESKVTTSENSPVPSWGQVSPESLVDRWINIRLVGEENYTAFFIKQYDAESGKHQLVTGLSIEDSCKWINLRDIPEEDIAPGFPIRKSFLKPGSKTATGIPIVKELGKGKSIAKENV